MLENDITDVLDLAFAEEADYFGRKSTVELKPDGAAIKASLLLKEQEFCEMLDFFCTPLPMSFCRWQGAGGTGNGWEMAALLAWPGLAWIGHNLIPACTPLPPSRVCVCVCR
jgi:hypothetical protein